MAPQQRRCGHWSHTCYANETKELTERLNCPAVTFASPPLCANPSHASYKGDPFEKEARIHFPALKSGGESYAHPTKSPYELGPKPDVTTTGYGSKSDVAEDEEWDVVGEQDLPKEEEWVKVHKDEGWVQAPDKEKIPAAAGRKEKRTAT